MLWLVSHAAVLVLSVECECGPACLTFDLLLQSHLRVLQFHTSAPKKQQMFDYLGHQTAAGDSVRFPPSHPFVRCFQRGKASLFLAVSRLSVHPEPKCVWGELVCHGGDAERNRWAKLISPRTFKEKGIYLREWPTAGINQRKKRKKAGTKENFLFSKSPGKRRFHKRAAIGLQLRVVSGNYK